MIGKRNGLVNNMKEKKLRFFVGGTKIEKLTIPPFSLDDWWNRVKRTYCDSCNKMTGVHHYQGHFICDVCNKPTSFYITPPGFKQVTQPVIWTQALELITIAHEVEDK